MAEIYLTGAVSDWDEPFAWHDELIEKWEDYEFINPYELNDFELGDEEIYEHPDKIVNPALEAVEEADGLIVRWDDDAFLVGSSIEIKHAYEHGVPVVIWYDGWRDNLSPWLLHMTRSNHDSLDTCMKVMLCYVEGNSDSFNFIQKDA